MEHQNKRTTETGRPPAGYFGSCRVRMDRGSGTINVDGRVFKIEQSDGNIWRITRRKAGLDQKFIAPTPARAIAAALKIATGVYDA